MAARITRSLKMNLAVNIPELEHQTTKMGFTPNFPPSVFWYPQTAWGSSSVLLEKANLVSEVLGDNGAQSTGNWTPALVLPQGAASIDQVISYLVDRLHLGSLNAAQQQALTGFMSTQLQYDNTYAPYIYDNTKAQHQKEKGLGLYFLIFMSPKFQLL